MILSCPPAIKRHEFSCPLIAPPEWVKAKPDKYPPYKLYIEHAALSIFSENFPKNSAVNSENDRQKHFETLLAIYCMRNVSRHNDTLACREEEGLSVDCEPTFSVQHSDKRVTAGGMCAYLLALFKGKKRQADVFVLRKGLADDLPVAIFNLVRKGELCLHGHVFYWCIFKYFHKNFPL